METHRHQGAGRITVTEHDKREWSRLAQAAYAAGRNTLGHRYSGAAARLRIGESMDIGTFDQLQALYRAWLVFGWAGVDDPHTAPRCRACERLMVRVADGTFRTACDCDADDYRVA